MKKIKLTQGKYALVDDVDFEFINQWKWCVNGHYAFRSVRNGDNFKSIYMHRLINNTPENMETDHVNGDRLDNRRKNLRSATYNQNQYNRKNQRGNKSSRYKGVHWKETHKSWYTQIRLKNSRKFIGMFKNEDDAAKAYNRAAIKYHGEFALLNKVVK